MRSTINYVFLINRLLENNDGWVSEDAHRLGELPVLQPDDGDPGGLGFIINVLKLREHVVALFAVMRGILDQLKLINHEFIN